jgi:formamidopyrimidine-DNA glycosylase
MPEGDTILRAARALHALPAASALARIADDRPIVGRTVDSVSARGWHLLMAFSGDLVLRTHVRMNDRGEILFLAGIDPFTTTAALGDGQLTRIIAICSSSCARTSSIDPGRSSHPRAAGRAKPRSGRDAVGLQPRRHSLPPVRDADPAL